MGRGPKSTKGKAKPAVSRKSPNSEGSRLRDLEKRLAEALEREAGALTREAEAQAQQIATAEILRVISHSPNDIQPVFETIVRNAVQLCDAVESRAFLFDGRLIHFIAEYHTPVLGDMAGQLEAWRQRFPMPPTRETISGRAILDRAVIHVPDIEQDPDFPRGARAVARAMGYRSILHVPMLRDGKPIGTINVARSSGGFSDAQVKLLKTFADQAVIAIENVRLFNETKEALEQQTATADILRVISESPTDSQPVFDAIADSAVRLCESTYGVVHLFDGTNIQQPIATCNVPDEQLALYRRIFPLTASLDTAIGEAVVTRRTVQVQDTLSEHRYLSDTEAIRIARGALGYRTLLVVPMLHRDQALGIITVWRREQRPFLPKQIALVETFADQAVIAIENVRLFNETKEALEQQTATSDILRVISSSPTDIQPVVDSIAAKALDLCQAKTGAVFRFDGELIHVVAAHSFSPEAVEAHRETYPIRPGREGTTARAILSRTVVYIPDIREDPDYKHQQLAKATDYLSAVSVPMLHEGEPVGAITVTRAEADAFSPRQIALLQTFADQAVIAIENTRLFNETKEALEQQTATAEILRVISSSPTNVQPVLDAIVTTAVRLCDGVISAAFLVNGDQVEMVAHHNFTETGLAAVRSQWPRPVTTDTITGRAISEHQVVHIRDVETDSGIPLSSREVAKSVGWRSVVAVPMLREGQCIGAIDVSRPTSPFTDKQISLLQTFADQAVIAIENVRLFKELQTRNTDLTDALSRQTATSEILRVISGSPTDVQPVFDAIIKSAVTLCNGVFGSLDRFDGDLIYPVATHNYTSEALDAMHRIFPARPSRSLGVGRAILDRDVVHIPDVELDPEYRAHHLAGAIGFRSGLFVPMLRDGVPIGAILVARAEAGPFSDNEIALLKTFADQAVIAIENVRLFHELEAANRELSAASQHKSEFLANMSHELRTPLNAIIGFSEVLSEKMFGELNEKQEEYSKDIHASGQHLLSLINDILDLSKIEAGRMELELTDFHLPTALDSALTLVRERAGRRSIALHLSVDDRLGQIQADERKVRQVVLNLLSNAIKFTPEGGRIEVAAMPKDGFVEVAVSDTGVGIAPEDQEAVFEEFRQVGTADKKVEGTGLGLTLCRKFVELHGGTIRLKSELGAGSTFTFTLPLRDPD